MWGCGLLAEILRPQTHATETTVDLEGGLAFKLALFRNKCSSPDIRASVVENQTLQILECGSQSARYAHSA